MRRLLLDPLSCILLFASLAIASSASAQLPTGNLTTLKPPGGKQGTTVAVTATGSDLDDGDELIFNHPGIQAKVKQTAAPEFRSAAQITYNQFDVTIGADVPPGAYEARVVGRYGASSPRTFVVGLLDEIQDDGSNKTLETAKEIPLESTVNGNVDAASHDYYKINVKANQRVIVDCSASRIDSRLDPVVVLYSADQRELKRARRNKLRDAVLDFTAPMDGEYIIEIYDFVYRGGAEYFYRVSMHSRPYVDFVLPLAGVPGSDVPYSVYGRNLPGGVDTGMKIDGEVLQRAIANLATPTDASNHVGAGAFIETQSARVDGFVVRPFDANPFRLGFASEARLVVESEPNNDSTAAQVVQPPCELHGQFYPSRDEDWVEFQAEKGQVFWIDTISQRLGLATDPYVAAYRVVKNDQGEESLVDVAQVDDPGDRAAKIGGEFDTSTDDAVFRFVAPEAGVYRLRVRDQFGVVRDDPRSIYRLAIRTEKPDFRLFALPQQTKVANANIVQAYAPTVRRGGASLLRVDVVRRDGFQGEVALRVEGLPEGVTCREATIPAGAATAWLMLEASEGAAQVSTPIRVIGKATIGESEIERDARSATVVWGTGNKTTDRPIGRAMQDLVLSVTADAHQVQAVLGDGNRTVTSKGGIVSIPLKVTRRGFDGDIKFVAQNLPAEVKPGDLTVKKDGNDTKLEWTLTNAKANPGVYQFYLRGDVKVKHVQNPDAIARAEAAQKEVTEAIAGLTEAVKEKTTARDAANKAATDAGAVLKQAEQALKTASSPEAKAAAEKSVAEAKAAADSMEKAKAAAEQALKEAQDTLKRANDAKKAVDKQVDDVKKANAPKDRDVMILSSPVTLEVVATPIAFKDSPTVAVKQGEKATLTINLERLYGFADAMEITATPPGSAKGLTLAKATVAKEKADAAIEVSAAADAAVGEHTVTLKATAKFNNVPVETTHTVTVRVDAK